MAVRGRESEPPQSDPIAYFLTWPTYGTWLPGDERGWVEYRRGWHFPDPIKKLESEARMTEGACILDNDQRKLVEATIRKHCQIRGWTLHAVNCRTNHLHVVVTADRHPDVIREQFKAWCTRKLKDLDRSRQATNPTRKRGLENTASHAQSDEPPSVRQNWWAERGSKRYINDVDSLEAAILYVRDGQDRQH